MAHLLARTQLKDVVQALKTCKSLQEEKRIIAKECAEIRDNFISGNLQSQCIGLTKLLYFYILGYPANYGQMECLKLISSQRFVDKRIGYLGCMLLLDENAGIHLLITNSLQSDLTSSSESYQSLALCTLACVCSVDMARNLALCVKGLMSQGNKYVQKKAILCANRLILKSHDLIPTFLPEIQSLFTHPDPSIIHCACILSTTIIELTPENLPYFQSTKVARSLIELLTRVISIGAGLDYSSHDISSPFIQVICNNYLVKALKLLSYLCKNDSDSSAALGQYLEKLFKSCKELNLTTYSVLYEASRTVFELDLGDPIHQLAMDVLGALLASTDICKSYVGLGLLIKIAPRRPQVVMRYWDKIFYCLNKGDPVIQRRCIEFLFLIINEDNFETILKRCVLFLYLCNDTLSEYLTTKILGALERFSAHVELYLRIFCDLLETAPQHLNEHSLKTFNSLIETHPEFQIFILTRMVQNLKCQVNKPIMIDLSCWIVGQYSHLLEQVLTSQAELVQIFRQYQNIIESEHFLPQTRYIAFMAILKIAATNIAIQRKICEYVARFNYCDDTELQQRAVEWCFLIENYPHLIPIVFRPESRVSTDHVQFTENKTRMKEDSSLLNDLFPIDTAKANNDQPTHVQSMNNATFIDEDLFGCDFGKLDISNKPKKRHDVCNFRGLELFLTYGSCQDKHSFDFNLHALNNSWKAIKSISIQLYLQPPISTFTPVISIKELLPNQGNEFTQFIRLDNPKEIDIKFSISLTGEFDSEIIQKSFNIDGLKT